MQYFKIGPGKFIEYDDVTGKAEILVKELLIQEAQEIKARIDADATPKTNAEWIAYAKANYPYVDHSVEQIELNRINAQIDAIKAL